MNIIFRIMRTDKIDYEEYEGFVVIAQNIEQCFELINNYQLVDKFTWLVQPNNENLIITQYGFTEFEPQVVLASFNNG